MADVINMENKRQLKKHEDKAEKLRALAEGGTQCERCAGRCAKCAATGLPTVRVVWRDVGLSLCHDCAYEYNELLARVEGEPGPGAPFWYNRPWMRQWLAWLEYQEALQRYVTSPEVELALGGWREDE